MGAIVDGEYKIMATSDPVIFKVDKDFTVARLNFQLSAQLLETTNGQFDIVIKLNEKQIFSHQFNIDVKYTINASPLPASFLIEMSGAGIVDGHPAVRLKLSAKLNVILTKAIQILDQEISTAYVSKSDVQLLRQAAGDMMVLSDKIKVEGGFFTYATDPTPTIATTVTGLYQGGYKER